jgi:hypothetical protein
VLDELAAIGPFFSIGSHPRGATPAGPWRPVSELLTRPEPLLRRIASVRAALAARGGVPAGEIDRRAAASAAHLGLAARLAAPALGAAALGAGVDCDPAGLWWQDTLDGPVPLSVPVPAARPAAADWHARLIDEVMAPLTAGTARLGGVSGRVLWGNVASGINAAANQVARARPDLAGLAWECARALLASPWLSGEPEPPGPAFRRTSCCLFYRLAPRGQRAICGDCVLGADR